MKAVVVIAFYVWLALTVAIVLGRLARWSASRQAAKRRRLARAAGREQQPAWPVTSGVPAVNGTIDLDAPRRVDASYDHREAASVPSSAAAEAAALQAADAAAEERRAMDRRGAERRRGDRRHADRRHDEHLAVDPSPSFQEPAPAMPTMPASAMPAPAMPSPVPAPAPAPAAAAPAPTPTPTVAQLLAGIAIPVDLVPIAAVGSAPNQRSTTLISRQRPAHEVGTGIADELERLGYELEPIGIATLRATRGNDILTVEIDQTPSQADANGVVRFPTAGINDVIVEFWVGSGPRPT